MSETTDVVVVGSGGAGLTAALVAALAGRRVTVVERSDRLGGTTAISGGGIWIPDNRFMRQQGLPDSPEDAVTYLRRLTLGAGDDELITAFVEQSAAAMDFLSENTAVPFLGTSTPDYQPTLPGARAGRNVAVGLYDASRLGAYQALLRLPPWPGGWPPLTHPELEVASWGLRADTTELHALASKRRQEGIVARGAALVGGLVEGCVDAGVTFLTSTRVTSLVETGGQVSGVVLDGPDRTHRLDARLGVVLASGGFEWNADLVQGFLGVPMNAPLSPPDNTGDGLLMAMRAGARLGSMNEAWWMPSVDVPGAEYDGAPFYRMSVGRAFPGMIIVNAEGRRFVDESLNYNDMPHAMQTFDPGSFSYPNLPAYVVFDAAFRAKYPLLNYWEVFGEGDVTDWVVEGATIGDLAERAGISRDGLEAEVQAFNTEAAAGRDPAFGRGQSALAAYRGDTDYANPTLGPLGEGPYYAYELRLGCLGTKGGPVTDRNGRVVRLDGSVIPGLWAAGNVAASMFGKSYPGAGGTLGPALAFGYAAGMSVAALAARSV
ncbi:MAG: 3-oxosteroid 1-dehydrogenase [Pseudonocardiales bacterium]|nr:3-oxosteroid 1-dehydrogenase [Pseudonocardiales bacterium]